MQITFNDVGVLSGMGNVNIKNNDGIVIFVFLCCTKRFSNSKVHAQ